MAKTDLRIKALCKQRGITQAQLAERLNIKPVSFSQALARKKLSMDYLENIANALDCTIPDLFDDRSSAIICPHCGKEIKISIT